MHKISVCLATYNGERFILEQINSILEQLGSVDEIIVVDDCSIDKTIEIINNVNDNRIKIFKNNINRGHVYTFNKAMSLASNEIIFMSDQDDIWLPNRISFMKMKLLESDTLLITSNSMFMDNNGSKINFKIDGVRAIDSDKYCKNILSIFAGETNYYGCAMAFHERLKKIILPIPDYVESHDLWIAIAANLLKSNLHVDEKTFMRRIHGNNVSVISRPLFKKLNSRIIFARSVITLFYRSKKLLN